MNTTTLPNADNPAAAGRAMHFYHTVAAPVLTGSLSKTFWRAMVVPQNAIAHCRRGINILNEVQADSDFLRHHVVPAMHQLSLVPYCYDADPKTFPTIQQASPVRWRTPRKRRRGIHATDNYTDPNGALFAHRRREALGERVIQALKATYQPDDKEHSALCLPEIRYTIKRTLILLSEATSENEYDAYLGDYRAVVDLTARAAVSTGDDRSSWTTPFYTDDSAIELGLSLLLYLVASKCRFLIVRTVVLNLMEQLAQPRVNSWVKPITVAVAGRIIEVEHQVSLDDLDMGNLVDDGELLPEERRVISVDFRWASDTKCGGSLRQVAFLFRDPSSGNVIPRDEWINVEQ
ncbi:hypothetical protein CGRA01v4_07742 [Colletotrichum graminicola]|nr:hypothetical protein CGRA01v4_07742 [Colletotrichum graminicola]